jgi:hypothetical protein
MRRMTNETELHRAVRAPYQKGDPLPRLEVVRGLLDAGAEVNAVDDVGYTPLMRAVMLNEGEAQAAEACLAVLRLLLERGARVPAGTDGAHWIHSPVEHYAALLEGGARVDGVDWRGRTPLHAAASSGRPAHAALLLARGVEVNAIDGLGRTALGTALEERGKGWVKTYDRGGAFTALIALLEQHGAVARVALPVSDDPFAPVAIGADALRAAVTAAEFNNSITSTVARDFSSVQALVAELRDHGEPEQRVAFCLRLAALLPRRDVVLRGDTELRRPFVVHGDLTVEGHLDIRTQVMITGDLVVRGVVRDGGNDSCVTVGHDLRCQALYTDGELAVGGTLAASDVVLGYYNDFILAADSIRATLVIEDDHATTASMAAGLHFDINTYGYDEGAGERLRALLVDDVMGDGQVDRGALFRRLRQGERIYRWPDVDAPASPEGVATQVLWLAARLASPVDAAPFVPALACRELGVTREAVREAVAWALDRMDVRADVRALVPDQPHAAELLRAYLDAVAGAVA